MAFIKCQYTNDYLLTADSDSQKTKENGNAYQPEEKTVKKPLLHGLLSSM